MPHLIFCGNTAGLHEAHLGLPQWHGLDTICSRWRKHTGEVVVWGNRAARLDWWLETLTTFGPRWATGPPVYDWPSMSDAYAQANVRLREGILVELCDERIVGQIPPRYALLVDVRRRLVAWELRGRRVWLRGGNLRAQWLAYCELVVAGATVEGLLLPLLRRQGVLGADLCYHGDDEAMERNARFLRRYWRGVAAHQKTREAATP